ncbi:helix-turn-helix domain-containing protein [Ferruginibacter sp. HRS2-29]|uniref:helix-turn-helix domain-containing protein n=1 Tax=Ferruginibacter sp. HRS2-29 TaxID=2487334 RepID=UPI0020CC7387|nr:helix-turn-helix domain-containing protein [Ferruginibacter sp. HRS2-29]MCP9749860.1 hypothetical protein [Ferruginibacter sp. HRS2-29]
MESLKALRSRYGFTQQVAATLLDVNLAQLALAETGKRALPGRAMEKFRELEHIAENAPSAETSYNAGDYSRFMKQEYQKTKNDLFKYGKDCAYKLQTLQRKLEPLQEKRTNAQMSLALISHLRVISTLTKGELFSIKKAESDIRRTLKQAPQSMIDKLVVEIEALRFISKRLDEKLEGLNRLLDAI